MSNQLAADVMLDALGDPTRRRILERLRTGPRPVGELADQLPVGRPAVSKHLKVLQNAGLVEHSSRGTRNLYSLAPDGLRELQQYLIGLWDVTLQSFAEYVATAESPVESTAESTVEPTTESRSEGCRSPPCTGRSWSPHRHTAPL